MLLVLDPHDRAFHRLGACFSSRTLVRSWAELDRLTPDAECSVLVVERADLGAASTHLRWYRRRHPLHPVVLVTEAAAWAPRPLRGAEVVHLDTVEHALAPAVRRAVRGPPRVDPPPSPVA